MCVGEGRATSALTRNLSFPWVAADAFRLASRAITLLREQTNAGGLLEVDA